MLTENSRAAWGSNGYRNIRLLVVDDDAEFTQFVSEYLAGLGYLVETAHNGREGLGLFRSGNFHAVLADMQMPGMNGVELLQSIKRVDQRAVVVITTGYRMNDLEASAVDSGAFDLLLKPVTLRRLGAVVERAVEQRGLAKQVSVFRRLTLALVASIPFWIITSAFLALKYHGK